VKPWFTANFKDPRTGMPVGDSRGYRNGVYFIQAGGNTRVVARVPLERGNPPRPSGPFACEVVGRVNGPFARWGLVISQDGKEQFSVRLAVAGVLNFRLGANGPPRQLEPEPGKHPAIHKGAKGKGLPNRLLIVVQGRYLEIYVNGVTVCDPVLLDAEVTRPEVALMCGSPRPKGALAEFEGVVVGPADILPPLEKRGARPKGK
jgi:hypothetical protein